MSVRLTPAQYAKLSWYSVLGAGTLVSLSWLASL